MIASQPKSFIRKSKCCTFTDVKINKMPAGLYIHIPFCKSRCIYCEFYSQTEKLPENYTDVLIREAELCCEEWKGEVFDSLYFGGGTPSLLSAGEVMTVVKKMKTLFVFSPDAEITLECNPDDISESYAAGVGEAINRVSIGIQSFDDEILRFLSRRHNGAAAERAVGHFLQAGIENISIDLIYGIPGLTAAGWREQLQKALTLHVKHISCYLLTSHENTILNGLYEGGALALPSEEECYRQYLDTREILTQGGIMPYEISNFAGRGYESRHNMKYWKGEPWLGLGPSAHSYFRHTRRANPCDTKMYLSDLRKFVAMRTEEISDGKKRYNEYVMNRLRMEAGLDTGELLRDFPQYSEHFLQQVKQLNKDWYIIKDHRLALSAEGLFVSDYIIGRLFV